MQNEEFIRKAKLVHGDKYDYSLADYGSNGHSHRTTILCKTHGAYLQRPKNHLAGRGCPDCAKGKSSEMARSKASDEFVTKAQCIHGDRYDYSKVSYKTVQEKVVLVCKKHGDFHITPNNHLSGRGCIGCRLLMSDTDFVEKANKVHKHKYDYSDVVILDSCSKVKISCPDHGVFEQLRASHLSGDGCPSCSKTGYDKSIPGTFYILSHANLIKIGITNRDVSKRVSQIRKNTGKNFTVEVEYFFEDGSIAPSTELFLLKKLRKIYEQPLEKFDGSTECFMDADLQTIKTIVEGRVG